MARKPRPAELRKSGANYAKKQGIEIEAVDLDRLIGKAQEAEEPTKTLRDLITQHAEPKPKRVKRKVAKRKVAKKKATRARAQVDKPAGDVAIRSIATELGISDDATIARAEKQKDPRKWLERIARARRTIDDIPDEVADSQPEDFDADREDLLEAGVSAAADEVAQMSDEEILKAYDEEVAAMGDADEPDEEDPEENPEEEYSNRAVAVHDAILNPRNPEIEQQSDEQFVTLKIPVGDLQRDGYGISRDRLPRKIHERKLTHETSVAAARLLSGLYREKSCLHSGPWGERPREVSGIRDGVIWLLEQIYEQINPGEKS